jgi:hypothetical protein
VCLLKTNYGDFLCLEGFANTSFLFFGDWDVVQYKSDDTYNVIHDRNQNARTKIEDSK